MSDAESETGADTSAGDERMEATGSGGTAGVDGEDPGSQAPDPSDAFGALGGETRMTVLRTLFEAERESGGPVSRSFTELFEASGESTTAGFAYHLRQLTDTYLRKVTADGESGDGGDDSEEYRLTAAGRRVARAVAAGTLTDSVDRERLALEDPCPFCTESALVASGDDTVLTVGCDACDREVLALPFPPGGYRTHDDEALPAAVDRYYRGRIATMREGTCPECGGEVETAVVVDDHDNGAGGHDAEGADGEVPVARARMTCRACGYRLRCPVTLTLLEEPAVVAAFHAAGVDLGDRPLWNVGDEWRERVVSLDPVAVRVTAAVGDRAVACFVGRDLSVVHTDTAPADGDGDGDRVAGEGVRDRGSAGAERPTDLGARADGSVAESASEAGEEPADEGEPGTATA